MGFFVDFSKFSKCSNFFVFQSYGLRFSGRFRLALKRSFPRSFMFAPAVRIEFSYQPGVVILKKVRFFTKNGIFQNLQNALTVFVFLQSTVMVLGFQGVIVSV